LTRSRFHKAGCDQDPSGEHGDARTRRKKIGWKDEEVDVVK
jgi:hypothetical protein